MARETSIDGFRGVFNIAEAAERGVSRAQLAVWAKDGTVERVARGVYRMAGASSGSFPEIEVLKKRGARFVVALLSALRIHDFTTARPSSVWIAVARGGRTPTVDFPLEVVSLSGESWTHGVQTITVQGVPMPVFSPAKTVADLFKFRNRTGLDLAIESLREGLRKRLFEVDELMAAAAADRMERVIVPYVEALM